MFALKHAQRTRMRKQRERETCKRMEREKQGMNWRPLEKIELKSETISSSGRCSARRSPNTTLESSKPSVALFFIFSNYETSHTDTGTGTAMDDERHRIMIREERTQLNDWFHFSTGLLLLLPLFIFTFPPPKPILFLFL